MQHHISCAIIGTEQQLQQLGISGGKGVPGRADDEINELLDHGAFSSARGAPTLCRGGASPRSSTTPAPPCSSSSRNYAPRLPGGARSDQRNAPRSRLGSAAGRAPLCLAGSGGPWGSGRGGRPQAVVGRRGGGANEREQWPLASGMIRTLMKRRKSGGIF